MNYSLRQSFKTICVSLWTAQKYQKSMLYSCCLAYFSQCKNTGLRIQPFVMSQSVWMSLSQVYKQLADCFMCRDLNSVVCCSSFVIIQGSAKEPMKRKLQLPLRARAPSSVLIRLVTSWKDMCHSCGPPCQPNSTGAVVRAPVADMWSRLRMRHWSLHSDREWARLQMVTSDI